MKTKEIIIEKAREEFLEKGFQEASLRRIANQVGITATALYRHYSSKEDIFEAVVELAVKEWEALCVNEEIRQTGNARKNGIEAMWRDDLQTKIMVDLIYKDFEIQKILFFRSKGTKYENYLHELVTRVQTATLKFMKEIEKDGVAINHVDEKEMHLILSAQYSALLEMVDHDFSYDEAIHYAETISVFFTEGWRKFLGF